jgi:hypothetical protein
MQMKILKLTIFFISFLFDFQNDLISQTTFSRLFNIVNGSEYGTDVLLKDDHYYLFSRCYYDTNNIYADYLVKLNNEFEIEKFRTFDIDFWYTSKTPIFLEDTLFILGDKHTTDESLWKIIKYDDQCDSLGLLSFIFQQEVDSRTIIFDNYYIYLGGGIGKYPPLNLIYLIKCNRNGEILKTEHLNEWIKPEDLKNFRDMIKTSDGNLVFSYDFIDVSIDEYRVGICKVSYDFDVLWCNIVDGVNNPFDEDPFLTPTPDSGFVLTVGLDFRESSFPPQHKNCGALAIANIKYDATGNKVWADTIFTYNGPNYEPAPINEAYKLITCKNGDIVGAGCFRNLIKKPNLAVVGVFTDNNSGYKCWW